MRDGYTILFVGYRNHDEAVGTVGESRRGIVIIVESPEEVASVKVPDAEKIAFVTQTTLSVSDAMRTIDAIKKRFPNVRYPAKDDICYATTNRQSAVTQLANEFGCRSGRRQHGIARIPNVSSNGPRRRGRRGYLIDDQSELNLRLAAWQKLGAGDGRGIVLRGASGAVLPVARIQKEFGGEVETRTLVEEDVFFDLPKSPCVFVGSSDALESGDTKNTKRKKFIPFLLCVLRVETSHLSMVTTTPILAGPMVRRAPHAYS